MTLMVTLEVVTSPGTRFTQHALIEEDLPADQPDKESRSRLPWPARMADQAQAVRAALASAAVPVTAAQVAARFDGAPAARVAELLETLASLGQAEQLDDAHFVAG